MKPTALILGIVVSAALLAAAGVLYVLGGSNATHAYRAAIEQVRQVQALSSSWSVEIARVKADPLADFDSLAAFIPRVARAKERLSDAARAVPDLPDRLAADIQAYLSAVDAKEERIERFKTGYAVVRNSARYLPLAAANVVRQAQEAGDAALGGRISTFLQDMNLYLATPSDAAGERLGAQMETLREESVAYPPPLANALANLLAHAEILLERQAPTEALFAEATSDDIAALTERLAASLAFELDRSDALAANYERGVLGLVGVLALFWIGLAFHQRSRGTAVVEAVPELAEGYEAREPRIESFEPLPGLAAEDGVRAGALDAADAPARDLDAESAMRSGYLAEQVGENLAATAERVTMRMEALRHTHERIRTAIQGSDLMLELPDGADLDEEIDAGAAVVGHVRREVNAIADLSRRLAACARLPNGDAERDMVDVNACIAEVVAATGAEHAARVAQRLGDIPEIFASKTEIRLLLAQVLENAVRAVERLEARPGTIKIDTTARAEEIVITVIDNGDGIGPERRGQIFRPFYTSREDAMGLGLTLVSDLVKKYEGSVKVNSLPGRGTVARIVLPTGTPGP